MTTFLTQFATAASSLLASARAWLETAFAIPQSPEDAETGSAGGSGRTLRDEGFYWGWGPYGHW